MNFRIILCQSNFCFLPEGKIWFDWFCILRVKRTYGTQFILGESAWGKTLISVSDEKLPFCFNFFLNMSYMGIHRNYYQQPIGIITSKWGIKKYTGRWLLFLLNYTGYTVVCFNQNISFEIVPKYKLNRTASKFNLSIDFVVLFI